MEKWLPIYQIPKKGKPHPKMKYRLYRQLRKAKGLKNYTPHTEMTPEEYENLKERIKRYNLRRYHSDPKFKKLLNKRSDYYKKRKRQLEKGETKVCSICHTEKAIVDFETRSKTDKRPRHECKACRKERNRVYYEKNRDKHKTNGQWNVQIKRKESQNDT